MSAAAVEQVAPSDGLNTSVELLKTLQVVLVVSKRVHLIYGHIHSIRRSSIVEWRRCVYKCRLHLLI